MTTISEHSGYNTLLDHMSNKNVLIKDTDNTQKNWLHVLQPKKHLMTAVLYHDYSCVYLPKTPDVPPQRKKQCDNAMRSLKILKQHQSRTCNIDKNLEAQGKQISIQICILNIVKAFAKKKIQKSYGHWGLNVNCIHPATHSSLAYKNTVVVGHTHNTVKTNLSALQTRLLYGHYFHISAVSERLEMYHVQISIHEPVHGQDWTNYHNTHFFSQAWYQTWITSQQKLLLEENNSHTGQGSNSLLTTHKH